MTTNLTCNVTFNIIVLRVPTFFFLRKMVSPLPPPQGQSNSVASSMSGPYTVTHTWQKPFTSANCGWTVRVVTSWAARSEGSLEGWCCRSCQSSILGRTLCSRCGGCPGNEAAEGSLRLPCMWPPNAHRRWRAVTSFVFGSAWAARVGRVRREIPSCVQLESVCKRGHEAFWIWHHKSLRKHPESRDLYFFLPPPVLTSSLLRDHVQTKTLLRAMLATTKWWKYASSNKPYSSTRSKSYSLPASHCSLVPGWIIQWKWKCGLDN